MWRAVRRTVLVGVLTLATMALAVSAASASISPTISLDQSAGTRAGSFANLGVDLKFSPTAGDSPDELTLNLPPGLLANASIDGGACLTVADLNDNACQVGSGTVTADAFGTIPITTPVTFDLVPPPQGGDLAGLAVNNNGTQIGATGDVKIRPSGDPGGVGVTIRFVLPNMLFGVPISIAEINSTFDGLRYPTTCPSTPQNLSAAVDSYGDATLRTVTAPLLVTRCSSLAYSPAFAVTAARDSGDKQVKLTTQVTEDATDAPSGSVSLTFPWPALAPNLESVALLCPSLSSGTCDPVGSVTASSPLYPKPLTGQAYLTGDLNGLSLTLVFPSPFPLTLTGSVDLVKNSTTFTGLPDIPLTDLEVSLASGAHGLFATQCAPGSGTAMATLTDQNGDRTVQAPSAFTISGCPSTGASGGSAPSGSGAIVSTPAVSGLATGHPSLSLKVRAAGRATKLDALTIELPAGLSFSGDRAPTKHGLIGITLTGATAKSLSLTHGHLLIVLSKPTSTLAVKLGPTALNESATLEAKARANKLPSLLLTVIADDTKGRRIPIHVRLNKLRL
jgi:hypothetical protein